MDETKAVIDIIVYAVAALFGSGGALTFMVRKRKSKTQHNKLDRIMVAIETISKQAAKIDTLEAELRKQSGRLKKLEVDKLVATGVAEALASRKKGGG